MGRVHGTSFDDEPVNQFDPFGLEEVSDPLELIDVHAVNVRERRRCQPLRRNIGCVGVIVDIVIAPWKSDRF